MRKTTISSIFMAILVAACGGEGDAVPPPAAPPPPPMAMPAPAPTPEPAPPPAPEPPKPSLLDLQKQELQMAMGAMNAHDAKKFSEVYAPDAVSTVYGGAEVKGREAIAIDMQKIFDAYPDFKLVVTKVYVKGDTLAHEWVMNATQKGDFMGVKASNKPVGLRGVTVLWFNSDGLVKQEHRYFDANTVMAQIGASKAPARAAEKPPTGEAEWHMSKDTPEEEKQIGVIKTLYGAFDKKSEADFLGAIDEKATWSDLAAPKDMSGKDAKKFFQMFVKAFPDTKTTLDPLFAADEYVVAEVAINATHGGQFGPLKPTKKPVVLHSVDISTLKDGKVVHGVSYSNSFDLLGQEGLLPKPKPAKPEAAKPEDKKPAGDKKIASDKAMKSAEKK